MDFKTLIAESGYSDLKPLLEKWDRIAKRQKMLKIAVPLPNYYLSTEDGFRLEELYDAMAEYLEENKLMEFDGLRKAFSTHLKYSRPQDPDFPSFRLFFDSVEYELTKYNRPFGGILVIDITEWVAMRACNEDKFLDFLAYMDTIDKRTMAIFLDRNNDPTATDVAYKLIDLNTRVEKIDLHFHDESLGYDFFVDGLAEYNLKIDKKCEPLMRDTIKEILAVCGGTAIVSIGQLVDDIAYESIGAEGEFNPVIGEDILKDFYPDGEWVKSFGAKAKGRKGLGLI